MTKRIFASVFISALILLSACGKRDYTERFSTIPEKPVKGDEITVLYNPKGTKLESASNISAIVYQFGTKLDKVEEMQLTREDEGWFFKFKPDENEMGIAVKFTDGDKLYDNNNNQGYFIPFYENGTASNEFLAAKAVAMYSWVRLMEMDADRNGAYAVFNEVFKKDSTLRRTFAKPYIQLIVSVAGEQAGMMIENELNNLEKYNDLNEEELALLAFWFGRTPNIEKAEKYKAISLEKYPNGEVAERELYSKFRQAEDIDTQLNLIHEYKSKFPEGEFIEAMTFGVLKAALDKKDFDVAMMVVQHAGEDLHPYYFGYAATQMMAAGYDPKKIESVLKKGIAKGEEEVNKPDSEKPATSTLKNWREGSKYYLSTNYGAYGKFLLSKGDKQGAMEAYGKAVNLTADFYSNPQFNKAYVKLLNELNENEKAKEVMERLVKKGEAGSEIKEILKENFVKLNGSENGFQKYLDELEGVANAELTAKLRNDIIEKEAPDFTLMDLNGVEVSLSSLKGKTVVVDFWATWCGPCKKSFPGMKTVVEKFSDDDSVVFLFVNTWERVDDKKANADKFIKDNNYPFRVLLDEQNEVVEKFAVQGIPTKFVIDKNGKIRFKSVGFSGSDEALVDELTAMISMIK